MHYFGIFSAATAVLVLGLYFFSGGQSFGATLATYLASAISFFALSTLRSPACCATGASSPSTASGSCTRL